MTNTKQPDTTRTDNKEDPQNPLTRTKNNEKYKIITKTTTIKTKTKHSKHKIEDTTSKHIDSLKTKPTDVIAEHTMKTSQEPNTNKPKLNEHKTLTS